MKQYLAIEIGGTKLQLFVGDADANIIRRWRFDVDRASGGAGIRHQIEQSLPEILLAYQVEAIGVGYGGPVDWRTGKICCSHQIEGWSEFPLGDWLRERTGRPVTIDNDANVGALGEALRGAGHRTPANYDPVFYVTLGSGVGGGLVTRARIYHGANPGESEIGHVRLDKHGTIVEERCSGWAVDRRIRDAIASAPESKLKRLVGTSIGGEARHLAAALEAGDALAHRIINEVCSDLGFALSHVTQLMHPELIVLGGGLSLMGEALRRGVEAELRRHVMDAFAPGPDIRLAALREDAVPVGALLLAGQPTSA